MTNSKEIKLSDLKGNPNNPRFMKEENAKQLQNSISKLGDLSCIVFNERTGMLVGGHQRRNVITNLIGENPIVHRTTTHEPNEVFTTGEGYIEVGTEHYKVRFVDFSEEDEALAVLIANDNRNQGEYDMNLLPTMIDLADASNLSVDFGLMDFAEGFNFDLTNFGDNDSKHVEFDAKDTEIDTDSITGEAILTLTFNSRDYQRIIERLNEIKKNQTLDTNEEAIIFSIGL